MLKGKKVSVIIPAYGKEIMLPGIIKNIPEYVDKVYLIWDLPDTEQYTKIKNLEYAFLEIHTSNTRNGIGFAIQTGIKHILNNATSDEEVLLVLSGNGKDNPHQIKELVWPIVSNQADYVQGSRFKKGGESINLPGIRMVINKILPILWSIAVRKRISEVTNGFRAYNIKIFSSKKMQWYRPDIGGYEWEYYMNYNLIVSEFRHVEVPVVKKYIKGINHSKIRLIDGYQILRPLFLCPFNLL